MSQATPTDAVSCDECGTAVRLERRGKYGTLRLTCDCGDAVGVKVASATPEGWSE